MTTVEAVLAQVLASFVHNMAVGDYCHFGESMILRIPNGFVVIDNGEEVTVETAAEAVSLAVENES